MQLQEAGAWQAGGPSKQNLQVCPGSRACHTCGTNVHYVKGRGSQVWEGEGISGQKGVPLPKPLSLRVEEGGD